MHKDQEWNNFQALWHESTTYYLDLCKNLEAFFNSLLIMYAILKISHARYSQVTVEAAESECNITIPMVWVQEERNLVMKNVFSKIYMWFTDTSDDWKNIHLQSW